MSTPGIVSQFKTALCTSVIASALLTGAAVEIVTEKKPNPMMILMGAVFAAMARSSYKSATHELNTLTIAPKGSVEAAQANTPSSPHL